MGETCVPNNLQRVVVLGGLDYVLSLGIKPVGSDELEADFPHLKDKTKGIENVGSVNIPNLEKILQLKPDFILSYRDGLKENYDTLSKIAPTVIFPFEHSDKWKERLMQYAETLDRIDVAKQMITDYYARLEAFKDQMGERLNQLEVSIVRIYPNQIVVYLKDSFCGTILADAGVSRPAYQNQMGGQQDISKERIHDLDGDAMFVWTYGYNAEQAQQANSALKRLKADPLWSQLAVVKQGKVYEVPGYWIGDGPLAANAVVDDLFKYLVGEKE
ncbi:putative siderophore-binding lipoprotein YfiY [Halomicronema hongdechloris C2206]|uniref:Siderophore-binding lipoprotein YfiY n=2 Tax=Halomicronema hongdechloris TaxID=1209493 RepID=A0A1Z3HNA0_9CYAN|nr:putative siderophore-binding lipoprotein YfiY [Halomicronema hongdechloris C2206]